MYLYQINHAYFYCSPQKMRGEESSVFMHVLKRKMQQHTQAWPYQFLWKPFFPWNDIIVSGQLGKNGWFYETSQYIKKIFCPFDTDFHDMLKMFIVPSTTWFYCQQYNLYLKEYKFCMMYCSIISRIWICMQCRLTNIFKNKYKIIISTSLPVCYTYA